MSVTTERDHIQMFVTVNDTAKWVVAADGCYQCFDSEAEAEAVYALLAPEGIEASVFGSIMILPANSTVKILPGYEDRVKLDYMSHHNQETDLLALKKSEEERLDNRMAAHVRFGSVIDPLEVVAAMNEYIVSHEMWESFIDPAELARIKNALIGAADLLAERQKFDEIWSGK